jgi:hypothetical protein
MRVVLSIDERKVAVTRAETLLGRSAECDVVLLDRSVSRNHASIVLKQSGPIIRDLGSRNGTWVNGLRVGTDRRVKQGDRVRLGCYSILVREVIGGVERDDGWLAIQAALLVKASTTGRIREADEILFRLGEAIETRLSLEEPFSADVFDAAAAAVIDYANARQRPGWTRWAMGVHAKLGRAPGNAVRRSLENVDDPRLRSSGSVPVAATTSVSIPPKRNAG